MRKNGMFFHGLWIKSKQQNPSKSQIYSESGFVDDAQTQLDSKKG